MQRRGVDDQAAYGEWAYGDDESPPLAPMTNYLAVSYLLTPDTRQGRARLNKEIGWRDRQIDNVRQASQRRQYVEAMRTIADPAQRRHLRAQDDPHAVLNGPRVKRRGGKLNAQGQYDQRLARTPTPAAGRLNVDNGVRAGQVAEAGRVGIPRDGRTFLATLDHPHWVLFFTCRPRTF